MAKKETFMELVEDIIKRICAPSLAFYLIYKGLELCIKFHNTAVQGGI